MSAFGQQERRRQHAFRDTSPTISASARAPTDSKGLRHGHLLALGHEDENLYPSLRGPSGAKAVFASRRIKWWRSGRSGDAPGCDIPTRNLASSQLACVNFLLPLAETPEALVAMLRCIDEDICDVLLLSQIPLAGGAPTPSFVEFEWVGCESCLEGGSGTRGANTTSADALIVGLTQNGLRRAYVIEWKYVEEYIGAKDKGEGNPGKTRRKRYAGLYNAPYSRFSGKVPMDELFYEPYYQIMRLGLLADKMVQEKEFGITEAKVIVVCPQGNTAYRETITSPALRQRFPDHTTVETMIKSTMNKPDGFAMVATESLVPLIRESTAGAKLSDWVAYQHERYGY